MANAQFTTLATSNILSNHPLASFFQCYDGLEQHMETETLKNWYALLPEQIANGLSTQRWGDLKTWYAHWLNLPDQPNVHSNFSTDAVTLTAPTTVPTEAPENTVTSEALHTTLMGLHPWRKGPFQLFGIDIDTEWRSNLKWARIAPHIDLRGKDILDVGCGNGYYGWRMLGAGARSVIGIDPSPRFVLQWGSIRRYCANQPCYVLPLGIEHLPENLNAFDVTFSMGVLYHRKSHFDHLYQLKDTLKPGGHLVLETLVIPGPEGLTLLPKSRYAKMRNVWQLPSTSTLVSWLTRCGFRNINIVDESMTTTQEQRRTPWMQFESLADFLDPEDHGKTIEGYPAPQRAVLLAEKPN